MPPLPRDDDDGPENADPRGEASAELGVTQAVYLAPLVFAAVGATSESVGATIVLGSGATVGLGFAIAESSRGLEPGQIQVIESAGPWLVAAGARLTVANHLSQTSEDLSLGVMIGGYFLGPLGGILLAKTHPDSSTVAMANSGGMWMAVAIELVRAGWSPASTASFRPRRHGDVASAVGTVVGAGVGILGGALLGRELQLSRGRVWAIDLAIAAGLVVGGMATTGQSSAIQARAAALGMAVGGGLTMIALPDWSAAGRLAGVVPRLSIAADGTPVVGVGGSW
ncbi:MAG: hypothetical protein HY902_18435 [Deltaproteobacteria bacterium]|nr:hypothetical protein [Deltaproteobacteria bacterium]